MRLHDRVIVLAVLALTCFATMAFATTRSILVEAVSPGLTLTVDKGCDGLYTHGETVTITVRSTMTGYLTLYDFMPDGSVARVFPNSFELSNFIAAGETKRIPGASNLYRLVVQPPDGEDVLFAVITSSPYTVISEGVLATGGSPSAIAAHIRDSLNQLPAGIRYASALCSFVISSGGAPPPTPYTVSGRVTTSSGSGVSGVRIEFNRTSGSGTIPTAVMTDSNGSWSRSGFTPGTTYQATPSQPGYTFDPSSRTFSSQSTSVHFTRQISPLPPAPAPAPEGQVFGLLVGISNYYHPRFKLRHPDTQALIPISQNILDVVQRTLGHWFDHVVRLDDAQATRAGIFNALNQVSARMGPEDTFYFHFSGHGDRVVDTDGDEEDGFDEVIVAYDGQQIIDDELWAIFQGMRAKKLVLVFESCHSGTAHRSLGAFSVATPVRSLGEESGGGLIGSMGRGVVGTLSTAPPILALQASASHEQAHFVPVADGLSWFAQSYIEAFTDNRHQADTNRDGWVSFQEAFAWIERRVPQLARMQGVEQTPQMIDEVGQPVNVVPVHD